MQFSLWKMLIGFSVILMISGCEHTSKKVFSSDEKVTWKLATSWGEEFPPFTNAVTNMAQLVKQMSGGDFIIKIDTVNKHKSAFDVMDIS